MANCDCCQPVSLFAGLNAAQLQQALDDAQAAYMALLTGSKGQSYSYTQGDGARSVTYTTANLPMLTAYIRQLQQALSLICHARRPARFMYR
jgi:hypothetical protein